ncbi:MAG: alpha-galactosidase [Candidatus Latescibacterota bacterium]
MRNENTWTFGNDRVRRKVAFEQGLGIRTTSLINPVSGREFAGEGSEEFLVGIDGDRISGSDPGLVLKDVRSEARHGSTKTVIALEREGLGIELSFWCYDGLAVIRKEIRIQNLSGDRSFEVDGLFATEGLALAMSPEMRVQWLNGITDPIGPNIFSYLDYGLEERALEPGVPRLFTNQMPRDMSYLRQWKRGKLPAVNHSNYSYFPWIVISDPCAREGLYMGLEWSGPWQVALSPSEEVCGVSAALGSGFRHRLAPGRSLQGLTLFEGLFTGDLEDAGTQTQFFVEKHLSAACPKPPDADTDAAPFSMPPACWNSFWAFTTDISEELLKSQADEAARLGFEAFVVDYGWSRSAGDKRENLELLPSGMKALSQYVHGLGMQFGLWAAFASFDPKCAPTADPEEWFVQTEEGKTHDEENIAGTCACLASGYLDYVKKELDRIVTEYEVDWLKFDQNLFIECYASGHNHQNEQDALYFQVQAFYQILDHLIERHPNLIIECALSGALVLDFGALQRTHTAWLQDDHRSYFVRRCFYGASHPLPPRFCTACTAHPATNWDVSAQDLDARTDSAGKRRLFDYFYRASAMGAFNVSDDLVTLPPEAQASLARALALYKMRKRLRGPIRHLLSQPRDPREWDAVQIHDAALGEGMVFVFRPSSPLPETMIKLTGLDEGTSYGIRSENEDAVIATRSGRELMASGINVRIADTSGSEVLFLRANAK